MQSFRLRGRVRQVLIIAWSCIELALGRGVAKNGVGREGPVLQLLPGISYVYLLGPKVELSRAWATTRAVLRT